jgi:hypothetical protein
MSIKKVRGSQGDLLMKVIKSPDNEHLFITRTWGKILFPLHSIPLK